MAIDNIQFVDLPAVEPEFSAVIEDMLECLRDTIGALESVEDIVDFLWDLSKPILPRDRIGFSFIEKDGARVVARACRADYEELHLGQGYSAGLANSTLEEILKTGHGRIIHNLLDYYESHPLSESTRLVLNEGLRSSVTLPLKVKDRAVGFLFFASRTPNAYTVEHCQIIMAVLHHIAQAMEKVWLIRRLRVANEGYMAMLGFVSHELKSPLASIIARGQSYTEGFLGEVDPLAVETVERMCSIANYLADMVNDYLGLARLESGDMQVAVQPNIDLVGDVLQDAIDGLREQAIREGMTFALEKDSDDLLCSCDPALMRIVFQNILDNAIKYGRIDSTIQIRVWREEEFLYCSIRNEGVGFSQEETNQLFHRFTRLHQKGLEDRRGSGLGLYLAFWIVEQHGGKILAESAPGEWASFTVRLPVKNAQN